MEMILRYSVEAEGENGLKKALCLTSNRKLDLFRQTETSKRRRENVNQSEIYSTEHAREKGSLSESNQL